jgi:GTPase SAR1 family protein
VEAVSLVIASGQPLRGSQSDSQRTTGALAVSNGPHGLVMGLLTILKKVKQKEREVRVLMLGLDNAGKTTVVKKFNGEDIDLISPTLGFNIKTLEYRGFKLNIWDVGGQTSLRSYWRNYFEQTDGLIWVVDSADRMRLRDCKAELQALLQQEVRGPAAPGLPR